MRHAELNIALKKIPQKKDIKILELGGGDGYIAKCLADKGYDIISLDINPKFPSMFPVKKIKDEELDFPNEMFDFVNLFNNMAKFFNCFKLVFVIENYDFKF